MGLRVVRSGERRRNSVAGLTGFELLTGPPSVGVVHVANLGGHGVSAWHQHVRYDAPRDGRDVTRPPSPRPAPTERRFDPSPSTEAPCDAVTARTKSAPEVRCKRVI